MKLEIKKKAFFKSLNAVRENKQSLLYTVLIDLLFFAALFILGQVFNAISYSIAAAQLLKAAVIALLYYLALLFIYSFFKHIVLHLIKSSFGKHDLEFGRLGKFYLLNIIIFVMLLSVFLLLSLLVLNIKQGIAPYASLLILLLFSMFAYAFANINQILFYEGKSLWGSLGMAAKYLGRFNRYYGIYAVIIAVFSIIFLLFTLFGNLLKITLFQDYDSLLKYGDIYTIIFMHAVGIIFYIAILFNRYYFYNIVKEKLLT